MPTLDKNKAFFLSPVAKIVTLMSLLLPSNLPAQSLNQVLQAVRQNSLSYKKNQAKYRAKTAESETLDSAYDWRLKMDVRNVQDNTEQNNRFSGDQRLRKNFDVEVNKMFSTGTQVGLAYNREWQDTLFPAPTPATTLPDGTIVPGQDPSAATIFNPAYINTMTLNLVQPLWKNFMSREVEYKKTALDNLAEMPRYSSLIQLQADQYRAERLYWAIIALNKRIYIMGKLLGKAQEFARQMKQRVELGRGENVDLADAEARVLQYETDSLDLEIARSDLRIQLATLMYEHKKEQTKVRVENGSIIVPDLQLRSKKAADAVRFAEQSRLDLRLNIAQQKVAQSQILSAKEEGKWDVSLYAQAAVNGIEEKQEDSFDKVKKAKNVRNVIGLKLDVPLGVDTATKSKIAANYNEKTALEIERRDLLKDIKEKLEISYVKLVGAAKKEKLIQQQISSLEKKREQEYKKLKRARSEKVAVIRYEMEVLSAEISLINTYESLRNTEAEIRFLTHGYPARSP